MKVQNQLEYHVQCKILRELYRQINPQSLYGFNSDIYRSFGTQLYGVLSAILSDLAIK